MVTYQVDMTTKQLLQILSCLNIYEKLGGHRDENVNIAVLMMIATGYRTEQAHGGNSKLGLEFLGMCCNKRYDFLSGSHLYFKK